MDIKLEVCTASLEDCITSEKHGADRVELNSGFQLGGLTPSYGLIREVIKTLTIPIIVMIRPRPAGFCYSNNEFKVMQHDIEFALESGATGIATGVLNNNGSIDVKRCKMIKNQVGESELVFHRAFDVTPSPFEALEQLVDLGYNRVLTSGQKSKALEGSELLSKLITKAKNRIEILPGSGININSVVDIVKITGCTQVHASLSHNSIDESTNNDRNISFSAVTSSPDFCYTETNPDAVKKMRQMLNSISNI